MEDSNKYTCNFCTTYNLYRWAIIMECKCSCHDSTDITGHDSLCCEFPNGKRKDNPYNDLKPARHYKKILDKKLIHLK